MKTKVKRTQQYKFHTESVGLLESENLSYEFIELHLRLY